MTKSSVLFARLAASPRWVSSDSADRERMYLGFAQARYRAWILWRDGRVIV
jgi:hypothetical protein